MNTTLWIIYGIGVVLFPLVAGMVSDDTNGWDVDNVMEKYLVIGIMSFAWPFVLAVSLVVVIVAAVVFGFGALFGCLFAVGEWVRVKAENFHEKSIATKESL